MDTPLAAVVHEKNVYIRRGKAAVTMKTDKLMTPKTADKECIGASKEVEKNQMTQGMQRKSDLQGFGKGNKYFDDILTDEEIKQCSKWAPFGHVLTAEQVKQCYEGTKDGIWKAEHLFSDEGDLCSNLYLSDIEPASSELEESLTIEEGVYETDESDFKISIPERLSSVYTPEELDDRLGVQELWHEDFYPLPELA